MKLFTVFIISIASTVAAFAQAELPMIRNSGAYRAEAIRLAADVNNAIWSLDLASSPTTYDQRKLPVDHGGSDILEAVASMKLAGETVNTSTPVQAGTFVYSTGGDIMFEYQTEYRPVQVNGVWVLPKEAGEMKLRLTGQLPITMEKPISFASLMHTDKSGNVNFYDLRVSGNKFYYALQSVGLQNAQIRVNYTDQTSASYTVTDGKKRQTTPLTLGFSATMDNFYSFRNPSDAPPGVPNVIVKVERSGTTVVGVIPTIEVIASQVITAVLNIRTSEGKVPIEYWIRSPSGKWTSTPGLVSNLGVRFPVEQGRSYVVPIWKPEDLTELTVGVSTGNNGKG